MTAGQKIAALVADGWQKKIPPFGVEVLARNINSETEFKAICEKSEHGGFSCVRTEDHSYCAFQVWKPLE